MKFETLSNNKKRIGITLGVVGIIVVVGVTAFTLTRASYKQTQSVPLLKGSISYNKSDIEIVAIKLQQDDGSYKDANEVPSSGYKLNTDISKSYCKVGNKTNNIYYSYDKGTWYIKAKEKGTKCYLSFDKGEPVDNFAKTILDANGGAINIVKKGNPDFSKTATTNEGMYAMEDDDGISYYFRGAVTNNYVKFGKHASNYSDKYYGYSDTRLLYFKEYNSLSACQNASNYNVNCTLISKAEKDMYWRIIRINGDGTIRLIYDGSEYHANGTSTVDSIAVANTTFNPPSGGNNAYVGYTYGPGKRDNMASSTAKMEIDNWYTNSGLSNYSNYLSDSGFCGDRTSTTTNGGIPNNTGGTGSTTTYYGAYYRLEKNKIPTLKCSTISYGNNSSYEKGSKLDLYTVNSLRGNKYLTYPIALISADEAVVSGVTDSANTSTYYLYNGQNNLTMTFQGSYPVGEHVYSFNAYLGCENTSGSFALRPVINIDPTKINNVTIDSNGVYVIS